MKKATVFISTAALFAGTACGVYAESGDSATASFDRSGAYIDGAPSAPSAAGMDDAHQRDHKPLD